MIKQILRTQEEVDIFLREIYFDNVDFIAIDIETDWFSDAKPNVLDLEIEGIGLYNGIRLGYIIYNKNLDLSQLNKILKNSIIIGHNLIAFDLLILERDKIIDGICSLNIRDTKLIAKEKGLENTGLKHLAKTLLGKEDVIEIASVGPRLIGVSKEESEAWEIKNGEYCCEDCINTMELYFLLTKSKSEYYKFVRNYRLIF